jgi:hypothetical protein
MEAVVPCGQMDRQTDMPELIVAFRNIADLLINAFILKIIDKISMQDNQN